jgi:hypothetical protein
MVIDQARGVSYLEARGYILELEHDGILPRRDYG